MTCPHCGEPVVAPWGWETHHDLDKWVCKPKPDCDCHWETGTWFPCARHLAPHAYHVSDDPAPWCSACGETTPAYKEWEPQS